LVTVIVGWGFPQDFRQVDLKSFGEFVPGGDLANMKRISANLFDRLIGQVRFV